MAISYLSQIYNSNPYVIPVDLNLLQKVNTYKQTLFYKNAENLKSQIGALANSDILNPTQKDYLTRKVNNLTSQINQAGGLDYSDMNIVNQIEGFGSDIYNDPTVINGISSTKLIRDFNSNVQKLATDPKLNKYYNTSNITRIQEEQIKPYINGDINATYNGPNAPRPYQGNPFETMLKNMKNLPPDVIVKTLPNGTPALYNVQTKTYLSDQDISAAFDGLIDANTKAQLADDAWYNFDYSTGYKFDKTLGQNLYNDALLNKRDNYNAAISAIDIDLKSNIHPELKDKLEQDRLNYKNLLDQTNTEITKGNNEFSKLWDKDPQMAKYSLYVGKLRGDVIKAAGYSREKNDYIKNEEYFWEKRKELKLLDHCLQLNSDGSTSPIPGCVGGKGSSGKKGSGKGNGDNESLTDFTELTPTYRDNAQTQALAVNEKTIVDDNNQLRTENNISAHNMLDDFIKLNGWETTMGYKTTVNTTGSGSPQTYTSDLITYITGTDNYLNQRDLQDVVNQGITAYNNGLVDSKGIDKKTGKPYNYNITHDGRKFSMTYDQLKIISQLNDSWRNYGTGNINNLPDSFNKADFKERWIGFLQEHKEKEAVINANEQYVKNIYSQAFTDNSLSDEDKKIYMEWRAAGSPTRQTREEEYYSGEISDKSISNKYYEVKGVMGKAETPDIKVTKLGKRIEEIHKKVKINLDDAFKTASKSLNYYEYTLSDDKKNLPDGLIGKIIERRAANNLKTEEAKLKPLSIVKDDDGINYKINYNYSEEQGLQTIKISTDEAKNFGINPASDPSLEKFFRYGTSQESMEYFTMANTINPQNSKPIFYTIKKHGNEFIPYVVYKNKKYPVRLPQRALLASDAKDGINFLINNSPYNTQEEIIQRLIQ